jgi:hypothetical protein
MGRTASTTLAAAVSGEDLRAIVAELNVFPPFRDPEGHACNAAMWPAHLVLVEHADDTVTALSVDRSCGLVSNGSGAVRTGLPGIIADS